MPRFAEVLLPLSIPGTYTYRVPEEMDARMGCRVLVPFGRKKIYTGIIDSLHDQEPQGYTIKSLLTMLDDSPILRHPQLK